MNRRRSPGTRVAQFLLSNYRLRRYCSSYCFVVIASKLKTIYTTLGGGSLGSCVDEERSQLRELM